LLIKTETASGHFNYQLFQWNAPIAVARLREYRLAFLQWSVSSNRILDAPLAELGRERVKRHRKMANARTGSTPRSLWQTLTMPSLGASDQLRDKPELIAKKRQLGRERSLISQVLSSTGLRRGKIASLLLRHLHFTESSIFINLNKNSKENRKGNTVPFRDELAESLRQWIVDRDAATHEIYANIVSLKFEDEVA